MGLVGIILKKTYLKLKSYRKLSYWSNPRFLSILLGSIFIAFLGGIIFRNQIATFFSGSPGADPVAYWKFDEGIGSSANDSSGNNLTASLDVVVSVPASNGGPVNVDNASDFGAMAGKSRQVVRTAAGTLYSVLNDGGSCEVWKSSDGASWSEQDSGNNPACTTTRTISVAIDSSDILHIAYVNGASIKYITFTTSTDTFSSEENVYTQVSGPGPLMYEAAIAVDSADKPHIVLRGETGSISVGYYTNRVSGSWKSVVSGPVVSDFGNYGIDIVINSDDLPVIVTQSGGSSDIYAIRGNVNDASSFTSKYLGAGHSSSGISASVDSSGNIWVAYSNSANTYISLIKHNYGDSWTTWQSAVTNSNVGIEPSVAISGTDIYVFYEDDNDDIVHDIYNGSTWDGETTLQTGTYQDVHAKWSYLNDNQASTQIDYLYSDNIDVYWASLGFVGEVAGTGPTWQSKDMCVSGKCLYFDGTDDYAQVTDTSSLDITNVGTVQAWVRSNDVSSAASNFTSWTTLTAPDGADIDDWSEVDSTIVGDKIYYAAFLHTNYSEVFLTANSDLDGTSMSSWTSQTAPDGAGQEETTSVAVDSDGNKLYYAVFANDDTTEVFYTAYSDLDGSNFSSWTSQSAPDGAGAFDAMGIDMTIGNGQMYFAAYLHNDEIETFSTANSNLDGTGFSGWTSQTAPDGAGTNDNTNTAIVSDGLKLYYAAFANSNTTEVFYTATSNLDGTGFSEWTSQTAPNGAGIDDGSYIDMTLVGGKLYYAAYLNDGGIESFRTASMNIEGTGFSGWTSQTAPDGAGNSETAGPSINTDGKKLYYTAFSHNGATESFYVASADVTSHPVISKSGAYELIQTGGGFVFDWAGGPKSFGNINANDWNHIAVTQDGTTMNYYVNSRLVRSQATTTDFTSNANNLFIGGDRTRSFKGDIDEPKIYNYARTASQIKADFAARGSTKGVSAQFGQEDLSFLSDGLVGYWKMDEVGVSGANWTAVDSSGNNNNGIGAGNATVGSTAPGKFGNAGFFDGNGDYVTLNSEISLGSVHSICAWANPSSSDTGSIVAKESTTEYALKFYGASSLIYYRVGGSSYSFSYTVDDQLHYFCQVRDNDTLKTYRDGQLISTLTGLGNDTLTIDRIGRDNGSTEYNGIIDEVRIYNRVLDPSEVKALYEWAPGPVGWWKMDEGSGTSTIIDSGSNGLTGTMNGSMTNNDWVSGKYGKALDFDGADDQITLNNSNLDFSGAYTISTWIYPHSYPSCAGASSRAGIVVKGGYDTSTGYELMLMGNNAAPTQRYKIDAVSRPTGDVYSNNDINLNQWQHISVVNDTTTTTIYINGVKDTSGASAAVSSPSAYSFRIGNRDPANNYDCFFDGLIDDVKVYNYARTQGQIVSDMNGTHPAPGSPIGSAVLHYKMDEGYGSTVSNWGNVGSTLNGTILGTSAPTWTNDGKFGKALSFDGGDYFNIFSPIVDENADYTFAAWVKITSSTNNSVFSQFDNYGGIANYITAMMINSSNQLQFITYDSGYSNVTSTKILTNNQWYHVAVTKSGTTGTVYINGVADGTGTVLNITDTTNSRIGGRENGNPAYKFNGSIDEVKIYNFALDADQVKVEYNQGKSIVLGAGSTGVGGTGNTSSAGREYCVPGDSTSCSAPVAEWKFDEGVGGTVNDNSGNSNVGNFAAGNSAPLWKKGKFGNGLSFDGTNDYVTASDSDNLDLVGSFTLSLWVKSNRSPGASGDALISKLTPTTYNGWAFRIEPNGKLGMYLKTWVYGDKVILDNAWHYVSFVYNGDGTGQFYVDGVKDGSTQSGLTTPTATTQTFYMGLESWNTSEYPTYGLMDQIRIYNYARTPAQVAWEYNRGAPVAYYKMDECTGTTINDWGPNANGGYNGNTGTLTIGASGSQTSAGTCSTSGAWYNGAIGKRGSSINFDGTSDQITVTDNDLLDFGSNQDFTMMMWVNTTQPSVVDQYPILITKNPGGGSPTGYELNLHLSTDESRWTGAIAVAGTWYDVPGKTDISDGNWHHIVLRRSGNQLSTYEDGKLANTVTAVTTSIANSTNFKIGYTGFGDPDNYWYAGKIDEVKIYNYALTPAQIKTEMAGGAVRFE